MSFRSIFTPLRLAIAGAIIALLLIAFFLARDTLRRTEPFASLYLDFRAARDGCDRPSDLGDGGPATNAHRDYPTDVACAPDGTVYIATPDGARVRAVGTDGVIRTVIGGGEGAFTEGMPATEIALSKPYALRWTRTATSS